MRPAKNILLVEDEPTLQRILGSVLADVGHQVESVATAEQAIERLADVGAQDIDLVLSDKNLPAMSGLELLELVRKHEIGRRAIGFVLVTGYPSRDSALSVLGGDGDGYLVKPFRSLSDAVEQIQRVLDSALVERRAGNPDARRFAQLLSGIPVEKPRATHAAVLINDEAVAARVRAALEKNGVRIDDPKRLPPGPVAVIGSRVEDLSAFARSRAGAALVLVDGGASFSDIVSLITSGGGAIVDPGLLPGAGTR